MRFFFFFLFKHYFLTFFFHFLFRDDFFGRKRTRLFDRKTKLPLGKPKLKLPLKNGHPAFNGHKNIVGLHQKRSHALVSVLPASTPQHTMSFSSSVTASAISVCTRLDHHGRSPIARPRFLCTRASASSPAGSPSPATSMPDPIRTVNQPPTRPPNEGFKYALASPNENPVLRLVQTAESNIEKVSRLRLSKVSALSQCFCS